MWNGAKNDAGNKVEDKYPDEIIVYGKNINAESDESAMLFVLLFTNNT
jgi:hypothetical protein